MKGTLLFILLMLLPASMMRAQDAHPAYAEAAGILNRLFVEEYPLHMTLLFDVKTYQRTRNEGEYHPVEMSLLVNDTFQVTRPVRVKARGIFRRGHCQLPPFWINIKKAGIGLENFEGINKFKVVTRCRSNRNYDDYVLKEYLAYKLYEIVSPNSFRTRLVRLTIIDSGRDMKVSEEWAFLLEPVDMMARRLDAVQLKNDRLAMKLVNPEVMDLLAMFQFMIGNSDYSVTGRHNVKILGREVSGPEGLIPVPYDFDFTGFVNTLYSFPREGLPIKSTQERYFQGPCRETAVHLEAVQHLKDLEDEFLELILGFPYLEEDAKKEMVDYIESFYSEACRDDFVRRRIAVSCR